MWYIKQEQQEMDFFFNDYDCEGEIDRINGDWDRFSEMGREAHIKLKSMSDEERKSIPLVNAVERCLKCESRLCSVVFSNHEFLDYWTKILVNDRRLDGVDPDDEYGLIYHPYRPLVELNELGEYLENLGERDADILSEFIRGGFGDYGQRYGFSSGNGERTYDDKAVDEGCMADFY